MAIRAARYVLVGSNEDGIHADTCDTEERGDATTVDFRLDGNLSRRSHHNPDGSEWISTCEYDDRGRLTQMRTETAGGVAKLRFYEYDNAGRLLRVFARNRDGDHTVETYEYDPSGRKSKTLHVDVAAQRTDSNSQARFSGFIWGEPVRLQRSSTSEPIFPLEMLPSGRETSCGPRLVSSPAKAHLARPGTP